MYQIYMSTLIWLAQCRLSCCKGLHILLLLLRTACIRRWFIESAVMLYKCSTPGYIPRSLSECVTYALITGEYIAASMKDILIGTESHWITPGSSQTY